MGCTSAKRYTVMGVQPGSKFSAANGTAPPVSLTAQVSGDNRLSCIVQGEMPSYSS